MKIRVTILTENKEQIPEGYTTADVEEKAQKIWQCFLDVLPKEEGETAVVESVEAEE